MKLIAGGDSFVWGSELKDHKHGGPNGHSLSTFTALLATSNGMDYDCVALPGSGNDSIARRVLTACHDQQDVAVLVSWTWSARYEFRFNKDDAWETVSAHQYNQPNKKNKHRDFIDEFFRSVGFSDYWETYSSLREILRLQDHLNLRRIPYLFTISDNWFEKSQAIKHPDAEITALHSAIDWSRWFMFEPGHDGHQTLNPRGFYQWAVEEGYDQGPQQHPLEAAHSDAAQLMSDRFLTLLSERP